MNTTVKSVSSDSILFENGQCLSSDHQQDCCEHHWLSFQHLTVEDFAGMEFDLDGDFFERVDGFGIRLVPVNGHPVPVPGYGSNNGYYSTELTLTLSGGDKPSKEFDISDCQEISG